MTTSTKIINTTSRSRVVKPNKTLGDLPPSSGPTISASADRDKVQASGMKSMAAKLRRTKGSAGL
ncbi:MAG: hypothetical protein EON60_03910 [Alphaproteobacteria bacterium]|nr:MAG: hypothetical protein EON60_03910 [Alphaproteobacteria bacterium]